MAKKKHDSKLGQILDLIFIIGGTILFFFAVYTRDAYLMAMLAAAFSSSMYIDNYLEKKRP